MTDSPRPGRPGADPTDAYTNPYQAYSDPAYAGTSYGTGYSSASVPTAGHSPTEQLPPYWTQTYPQPPSTAKAADTSPPKPPRGPRPWLWAVAGFAVATVIALIVWLIFVVANPSTRETSVAAPSTTTTKPRTSTRTAPPLPPGIPSLPPGLPSLPSPRPPSNPTGETEPVTYEVTGQGRAISISYNDTDGMMQTEFNVLLPWHKDVELAKPAEDSASIIVTNAGKDVTCRISVDGKQLVERSGALLTVCGPSS